MDEAFSINGLASLGLYYFVADVHYSSLTCLGKIRNTHDLMGTSKMYRRLLKALPLLKADFGCDNFIEKSTPVVFQHFTVLRIIDYMLVSKQNYHG